MGRHIVTFASWFGLIPLSLCLVNLAAAQVDQQRAEAYFKEAATICQRDGGIRRSSGVACVGPPTSGTLRLLCRMHAHEASTGSLLGLILTNLLGNVINVVLGTEPRAIVGVPMLQHYWRI